MSFQRVVLVDDNEADNIFHELSLRRAGWTGTVEIFESPIEALARLVEAPAEESTLVLLDINMPRMSGFDLAERLGPAHALRRVTIVMLSSSDARDDIARARELPAISGFIVKPLLKELARQLLDGHIPPFDHDE